MEYGFVLKLLAFVLFRRKSRRLNELLRQNFANVKMGLKLAMVFLDDSLKICEGFAIVSGMIV